MGSALLATASPAPAQTPLACPADWSAANAEVSRLKRISLYKDEFETEATFEPAERRFMGRPVSRIYLTEDPLDDAITFVFPAGTNVLPALLRRAYGGACKDKTCILEPSTQGGLEYATYEQSSFRDQPTEMPTIRCVYNIGP